MKPLSSKLRVRIRRLVRNHGIRIVAEVFGISPGALALIQAGERCQDSTRRAIGRAFEQLGDGLGLEDQ